MPTSGASVPHAPSSPAARSPERDALGRALRQLRISVTDRCNFRCTYCMPRQEYAGHRFLPKREILSFEEIVRVARVFHGLGVRKVRLTGGEPLLRRDLPQLIEQLAGLGVDLALTTNGTKLRELAPALRAAGLGRLTVSLDTLDEAAFQVLSDAPGYEVRDVLQGLAAAVDAGFSSVKVNCVVRRDVSHLQIEPLVRHFRGTGHVLRFIEYMDVGMRNGWRSSDVVSGSEILERVARVHPIAPLPRREPGDVAERYGLLDGSLEVGVVTSISQPFCGACDRLRLSADGQVYTCLFASRGHDLKGLLRGQATDDELQAVVANIWSVRRDRYSAERAEASESGAPEPSRHLPLLPRVEMPFIGG